MAEAVSSFFRLHPSLQHAIVHDLGWRDLRPVQELAIEAVLDGDNAVVLAPTAGGKTEAAFFPLLSRILAERIDAVAALYICPIRALLNNQEPRLRQYAQMVGLDVFKWHGDVAASSKARFKREPKHILMITPESLEVMLISQKTDARALFANLSAVVIDEVHAFAGDDRGAHLVSILERLNHFCERDIQRVGLSATVGNPDTIGRWLQGSSRRAYRRVDPPKPPTQRDFVVDLIPDPAALSREVGRLGLGKKSLVFVESRSEAERIASSMAGRGVEVFVHHSAVSREDRQRAEAQFSRGGNAAIVCTSTMELGIDVGDLDQVVQVNAPRTVASMLQRLGRTGRRSGSRANCTFLCKTSEAMLQASALIRLAERGWVEDVHAPQAAAHVLAHQILALTLQEGGVSRHRILHWVAPAWPFHDLREDEVETVVRTMLARDILYESDGLLSLGASGEKLYGRKNFFELYAVFTAPQVFRVTWNRTDVGEIDAAFLRIHAAEAEGPLRFRLAGRPWRVVRVEWNKGVCEVVPDEKGVVPNWMGTPGYLSREVCGEIRRLLAEDTTHGWLTRAARWDLAALREGYAGLVEEDTAPLEDTGKALQWHTFAGGAINAVLAAALEQVGGGEWTSGNLSLKSRTNRSTARARDAIERLRDTDLHAVAADLVEGSDRGNLSKFQPCLPEALERRFLVERLTDPAGARQLLESVRVPPAGTGE